MDRQHLWPQTLADLVHAVEHKIAACRRAADPYEAVGLIFPDGTIAPLENTAEDPEHEYFVTLRSISEATARKGLQPVAIWHTHVGTEAIPSGADVGQLEALASQNDRPLMFICGIDGLRIWTWDDGAVEVTNG